METNTCILGTRNGIVGEWGIHIHGIQLSIITGVNIGSLKVSFLELNDCAHIYDHIVNESSLVKRQYLRNKKRPKEYNGNFTYSGREISCNDYISGQLIK